MKHNRLESAMTAGSVVLLMDLAEAVIGCSRLIASCVRLMRTDFHKSHPQLPILQMSRSVNLACSKPRLLIVGPRFWKHDVGLSHMHGEHCSSKIVRLAEILLR